MSPVPPTPPELIVARKAIRKLRDESVRLGVHPVNALAELQRMTTYLLQLASESDNVFEQTLDLLRKDGSIKGG